jgi:hypothetical protein
MLSCIWQLALPTGMHDHNSQTQSEKPIRRALFVANCTWTWFHTMQNEDASCMDNNRAENTRQNNNATILQSFTLCLPSTPYRGGGATSTHRALWPAAAAGSAERTRRRSPPPRPRSCCHAASSPCPCRRLSRRP